MKQTKFLSTLMLFLFALATAHAADLASVKQSMKQRLPQIEKMWSSGLIGENNEGYVEARGSLSKEQSELVAAENSDRKFVYSEIAKSTQTTPQQVGRQRAAQISRQAAPGLWLQDAEGKWYLKE